MESNKKQKSGSEKRKEASKRKLNEAAEDPKQAKLDRFKIFSNGSNTNETEVPESGQTGNQMDKTMTKDSAHSTDKFVAQSKPTDDEVDRCSTDESYSSSSGSKQKKSSLEKFKFISCKSVSSENQDKVTETSQKENEKTPNAVESTDDVNVTDQNSDLSLVYSKFVSDKGQYENYDSLNEDQITALMLAGPCQPEENDMPNRKFKKYDRRKFSSKFYYQNENKPFIENTRSSWLSYSPTKNYAYCHYCWIFGDEATKKSLWYTGYIDWKHMSQNISRHSLSKSHLRNAVAASLYRKGADIQNQLNKQLSVEAQKWKTILTIYFDVIRTCSGLGLAFRGHRENLEKYDYPGIYLSIIKLISRHNPILKTHIESGDKVKYLSKTIMYELLDILANQTRKFILNECKDARFFSILADSTTDVAHLDQMAIMLRYVVIEKKSNDSDGPKVLIKESFVCFTQLKQGDAAYIADVITALLFEKYGLQKTYLCGQGYDGAAVMAGNKGGLQKLIKEYVGDTVFAPYVHCTAHQLNLVLLHVVEGTASASIKLLFATIQKVYNYFSQSHRRWENLLKTCKDLSRDSNSFGIALLKELKDELFELDAKAEDDTLNNDNINEKNLKKSKTRNLHLKGPSATRWSARLKAVEAILQNFECIIDCLEMETSRKGATGEDISDARSLLSSLDWLFFLNLLWWHAVLQIVDTAQVQVQKVHIDLIGAQNCLSKTTEKLRNLRTETVYHNFVAKAKEKWEQMGWEHADFPVKRRRRVKKMAGEQADDSALETSDKHRLYYFEAIDVMCGELLERTNGFKEINGLFGFLWPGKLQSMNEDQLRAQVSILIEKYAEFFTTNLYFELTSFIGLYFDVDQCGDRDTHTYASDSPIQYLQFIVHHMLLESFPEVVSLFRLFITLPVSSASVERAMSSLKSIKEYRRSTMIENTLNDYAILFIERQMANEVDLSDTIQIFAEKKARRGFKSK